MQKVRALAATMDTFAAIYPQLQDIDFRDQAAQLQIPVYLVQGTARGPWPSQPRPGVVRHLDAPTKKWIEFAQSGHRPLIEEPKSVRRGHAISSGRRSLTLRGSQAGR